MKNLIYIFLLLGLFSCGNDSNQPTQESEKPTEEIQDKIVAKPEQKKGNETSGETLVPTGTNTKQSKRSNVFQKTLTDGKVSFDVLCRNGEMSKYQIISSGFENKNIKYNDAVKGQLSDAHLLDLNNDGFCEIYMVFNQTDGSGNKMIKGIASYRNKSSGEIYVKDTELTRQENSDNVFVEDKKLIREFTNEKGQSIKFQYKLSKGESSFVLEPVQQ